MVTPETVARWHRIGFRWYWAWRSWAPRRVGRRPVSREVRDLIFRMVAENPTWGAPRIHGELLMLGFDIAERSVSRWMKRTPRDPDLAKRWLAFLRNHCEAMAAMDFFTVPTLTFGILYCFFVISHCPSPKNSYGSKINDLAGRSTTLQGQPGPAQHEGDQSKRP